jgi:hypothetical protein
MVIPQSFPLAGHTDTELLSSQASVFPDQKSSSLIILKAPEQLHK